ncbi:MAG: sulfite exporter TauE/SafE family protein [Methylotenera sp.]|uniref:sulfite exporter TauE/SafE family protein n=1 Tax=Methylotenera sp. TaxID=2051956 RepID=UPI0024891F02|nr:sulfite exporter TauE/SafE family protein [Methylotenera sp.]MDI1310190.1 sulfite exporter TauE/SafE family protein [Methylotenera sp.]
MMIIFLGLFVGLVMGLTGAGGGIIGLPLLVFFLDMAMVDAAPIALSAVAAAATFAGILGLRKGIVRYKAAIIMAVAGSMLSPVGVLLAHKVDNQYLMFLLVIILVFIAYKTIRDSHSEINLEQDKLVPCSISTNSGRFIWTRKCSIAIVFSGAIAGFLSGLLGVGGGFIIVPILNRFSMLSKESVIATSLAVIALISISVLLSTAVHSYINWSLVMLFSAGAVVGVVLGKSLLEKISAKYLKYGFSLLLIIVALMVFLKDLSS